MNKYKVSDIIYNLDDETFIRTWNKLTVAVYHNGEADPRYRIEKMEDLGEFFYGCGVRDIIERTGADQEGGPFRTERKYFYVDEDYVIHSVKSVQDILNNRQWNDFIDYLCNNNDILSNLMK